jgi:hypothetical protein
MRANLSDTTADAMLTTSVVSTIAHFSTQLQPIVSLLAGLIAIASGIFAIRYYYIKSKN